MSRPPARPDPGLPQDPHLQAALRHAPDADTQAPPALSARILEAAREQAARTTPPLDATAGPPRARPAPPPWWRQLLGGTGQGGLGPRWASGLALLFVTVVAGLIWVPERRGVDILPPRPTALTQPRDEDRAQVQGQATPSEAPATAPQAPPAPAAEPERPVPPAAARPPRRDAQPPRDLLRKAPAVQPGPEAVLADRAPVEPPPPIAPAAPAPAPVLQERSASAQAGQATPAAQAVPGAAPPARRLGALESAKEEDAATVHEAARKAERKADVASRGTPAAAKPATAPAPPMQALRLRLAQAEGPADNLDSAFSPHRDDARAAPPDLTWRLLPEGRPQAAGRAARAWLDLLADAGIGWTRSDAAPVRSGAAAWSVQWQSQGRSLGRLQVADGQAWWQSEDGSWWQATLDAQAAAVLQRGARALLEPPGAAKPGNPR